MKPLYLNATKALRVMLDGPALRVRAAGAADQLFPFQRLSRVVVCGQVDWSTDALLACAQAGVPISFLQRDGAMRARMCGASPRHDWLRLDALLAEFLELGSGADRYYDWMNAQAHDARREFVYEANRGPWSTEPSMLEQQLYQRAMRYAKCADLKRFDGQVRALVRVNVESRLHELKIDWNAADLLVNQIALVNDLTAVLVWTVQNAKLTWIKRIHNRQRRQQGILAELDWSHAINFIESQNEQLDRRFDKLIRSLHIFLLDSVNSHGN